MTHFASADQVRGQIASILTAWGMPKDLVATTAEVMVETDLIGVESHGISMIMAYEDKVKQKRLKIAARPKITKQTAVLALIDAGAGLGHPAAVMAMELAADKAAKEGVGVVSVTNSHHFGAAGHYARIAVKRGLIGIVASSARGISVVPTGAKQAVLGTNPLAFAAPAGRNPPFVLDMATSTVAAGKVRVYGYRDKPLPDGWIVDGEGRTVKDANYAFDKILKGDASGGLTPIGGTRDLSSHKGYGLGMMVHILGGVLAGAAFSPTKIPSEGPQDPEDIGHFFLALDPKAFLPDGDFEAGLDEVLSFLRATPAAEADKPVLIAGDPEDASKARRLKEGIPIPAALDKQLRDVCKRAEVPYILA